VRSESLDVRSMRMMRFASLSRNVRRSTALGYGARRSWQLMSRPFAVRYLHTRMRLLLSMLRSVLAGRIVGL
jgi:hypothetical protein